jgi:hypothetical protein
MKAPWKLSSLLVGLLALAAAPAPAVTAPPPIPVLVAVRASHHGSVDRVVFEFRGGLPGSRQVDYVDRLTADGSGRPVRVAGQALLRVRLEAAQAHTDAGATTAPRRVAFGLPNVLTTVRSGDFEAVTTYGLGLARRTPFTVSTLQSPPRVVVEVRAAFPTVQRPVWFLDRDRFADNHEPFFVPVLRPVRPGAPATGLMDRLFAGPLPREQARGLRLLRSGASGYDDLSVTGGTADLRLTGGCRSGGSTVTIAGEVLPMLLRLPTVDRVVLRDPAGATLDPDGTGSSTPECLEP